MPYVGDLHRLFTQLFRSFPSLSSLASGSSALCGAACPTVSALAAGPWRYLGDHVGSPCVRRMCVVREPGVADTDVVVRAATRISTTGLAMARGDPAVD